MRAPTILQMIAGLGLALCAACSPFQTEIPIATFDARPAQSPLLEGRYCPIDENGVAGRDCASIEWRAEDRRLVVREAEDNTAYALVRLHGPLYAVEIDGSGEGRVFDLYGIALQEDMFAIVPDLKVEDVDAALRVFPDLRYHAVVDSEPVADWAENEAGEVSGFVVTGGSPEDIREAFAAANREMLRRAILNGETIEVIALIPDDDAPHTEDLAEKRARFMGELDVLSSGGID